MKKSGFSVVLLIVLGLIIIFSSSMTFAASGATTICRFRYNCSGAFTPSYDDMPGGGWDSLYLGWEPLQEKYHIYSSVCVCGNGNMPSGYTWTDFKNLLNKGWVTLANHSYDHADLTTLTAAQIDKEFLDTNTRVMTNLGVKLEIGVYPFGTYNSTVLTEAAKYFAGSRSCNPGYVNADNPGDYQILPIVNCATVADAQTMINTAIANHTWCITLNHGITEYSHSGEYQPIALSYFDQLFAYAKTKVDAGQLWNDGLTNVTKYIRERQNASITINSVGSNQITLTLNSLSSTSYVTYDFPLTLKTEVPSTWTSVTVSQNGQTTTKTPVTESSLKYVYYDAVPGKGMITLTGNNGGPTPTPTRSATPTPTHNQNGGNLAQGKTASADSSESTNPAANGNDGNTSTRWCAADGNLNHWWKVDLGQNYNLTGSEVTWESAANYKYRIETSTDNATWTVCSDKTANTSTAQVQSDSFTANARYVRITVTGLASGRWASFFEFKVFGGGSVATPTPTRGSTPTPTQGTSVTKYEAENTALSGGAYVATDHTGYSGTGFVAGYYGTGTGQRVTFTVNVAAAGSRNVALRYCNAVGSAQNISIYVNGAHVRDVSYANLSSWDTWADNTQSLTLNAGNNTIAFKKDSGDGCINLDYISVQ